MDLRTSLLVSAFVLLLGTPTQASLVDHSSPSIVATDKISGDQGYVLLATGEVLQFNLTSQPPYFPPHPGGCPPPAQLPVPVSELRFWTLKSIVTMSGHVWVYVGASPPPGLDACTWYSLGNPPVSPIPTDAKSLGSIKGKF